jgi:hypothetical protein
MASYTVINGTASPLTDINAGGDDVPAYSVLASSVLTNTELGTLLGVDGVAAIKSTNDAPKTAKIARVMSTGHYADSASTTYRVATKAVQSNVNLDGDDLAAYSVSDVPLANEEIAAVLAVDGTIVANVTADDSEQHWAIKIMRVGGNPGI